MNSLDCSVRELRGVGKVKAEAYAKMHISTLRDLVNHFPRAYENRGNLTTLADSPSDGVTKASVILTVGTEPRRVMIKRGMNLLKFRAFDETGICEITFFNQDYLKDSFPLGSSFRFWGKVERSGKKYTMGSPEFEPYVEGIELPPYHSVYRLTQGISHKQISQNIDDALGLLPTDTDTLPDDIRRKHGLCTRNFALKTIHQPSDGKSLAIAKRRLVFDELFTFALGINIRKMAVRTDKAFICRGGNIEDLKKLLGYKLTGAQERVITEVFADMARSTPMSRMIVGDVGCGKTVCAAAAIFKAVSSRHRAALMVPTEILARQHYAELSVLFEKLGFSCALLIGATTAANKRKIYQGLADPDFDNGIQIVIGTQALISEEVKIDSLGLVITDEQHRFGVGQRALLYDKGNLNDPNGEKPHLLVMSATPIPRTLALALYGDLEISKIDEMPPGRQRVDTFVVDETYRERLDRFIRKNVDGGGQVYIVCPAVEERECGEDEVMLSEIGEYVYPPEDDKPPLKAAVTYAQELSERMNNYRVAFVHGKMKPADKASVMQDFSDGKIDILVSTTVIEVGVNVPNAALMIVENAERFGLSQLHQLRGRVGRGTRKSYCILVSGGQLTDGGDAPRIGQTARDRLEVMRTTYDGFSIAEKDLAARGPGDFLAGHDDGSIRQSGGFSFRLADMCEDAGVFYDAFADASGLLATDPELEDHPELREEISWMFDSDANILN